MVYVDAAIWPYRGMTMCHLMADTLEELHAMAERVGMKRHWFQDKSLPHYDICKSKRVLAVRFGALEVSREQTAGIMREWRERKAKAWDI